MPVEDDDDRAAFFDPDEYGVRIDWTHGAAVAAGVAGLWSAPRETLHLAEGPGRIMVKTRFVCPLAALPSGSAQGDTLERDGVTYLVRAFLPDGTGMVTAELERA